MWFVFDSGTGALVSSGDVVAPMEELTARGLQAVEVADQDVPARWAWNPITHEVVALAPEPGRRLTPYEFVSQLTIEEEATIRAAATQSPALDVFLKRLDLAQEIFTADPAIQQGLGMLVQAGLLTAERAAQVGA